MHLPVYCSVEKLHKKTSVRAETRLTDEQLMIKLQQGDRDAFSDIVRRYDQDAIRLAYYYLANWEDAKDLSQDAFIKVFQQAHMFDVSQTFRPWFFRILVNHVLNFIKRKKRVRFFSIFDPIKNSDQNDGFFLDQIQEPSNGETEFYTQQIVWEALKKLSTNHRNVMILHEIEGLKENEISDIVKCSVGTVKSRLHYARKKLKKLLGNEFK